MLVIKHSFFFFFKILTWSGNIEIGLSCINPDTADLPSCARKLENGTWVNTKY